MTRSSAQGLMFMIVLLLAESIVAADLPRLKAVPAINIEHYGGVWYEIARYPNRFQRQCVGDVTASYRRLQTGSIEVVNSCRVADGGRDESRGVARPVSPTDLKRLEVRFAPAFLSLLPFVWGDYLYCVKYFEMIAKSSYEQRISPWEAEWSYGLIDMHR